jgi:hypothetical protein
MDPASEPLTGSTHGLTTDEVRRPWEPTLEPSGELEERAREVLGRRARVHAELLSQDCGEPLIGEQGFRDVALSDDRHHQQSDGHSPGTGPARRVNAFVCSAIASSVPPIPKDAAP